MFMVPQTADGTPKVAGGPSELLGSAAGGGLGPSGCEAVCDPHGAGHAPEVWQYLQGEVEEAWCPSLRDSRAAWGPGRIHGGLEPVDASKNCCREAVTTVAWSPWGPCIAGGRGPRERTGQVSRDFGHRINRSASLPAPFETHERQTFWPPSGLLKGGNSVHFFPDPCFAEVKHQNSVPSGLSEGGNAVHFFSSSCWGPHVFQSSWCFVACFSCPWFYGA